MNVQDVEGIGPSYAEKLAAAGITTTDELLERGARPKGRAQLAEQAGIAPKMVLEWVNHVDLMRLDGVGSQYADLLSLAGVDSPLELAHRNPANLARTFAEIDASRTSDVRRVPSEETVAGWVEQAKTLSRAVFHDDGPVEPGRAAEPMPGAEATAPMPGAANEPPAAREPIAAAAAPAVEPPAAAAGPAPAVKPPAAREPIAAAAAPSVEPLAAPAARPLASARAAGPGRPGLWARIKRALGMG